MINSPQKSVKIQTFSLERCFATSLFNKARFFGFFLFLFCFLGLAGNVLGAEKSYYISYSTYPEGVIISEDCQPYRSSYWASSSPNMNNNVIFFAPCLTSKDNGVSANDSRNNVRCEPTDPIGSSGYVEWQNNIHNACEWTWINSTSTALDGSFRNWADAHNDGIYYFRIAYLSGFNYYYNGDYFKVYLANHKWINFTDLDTLISPEYPNDCQYTIISSPISFNATGTIFVASSSPATWYQLWVIAKEFTTASTTYFGTSTTLVPSSRLNYSIPVSLPDGAWKISYLLEGLDADNNLREVSHYCEATGIGTSLPAPSWKEITETEFLGLEDCSGYSLLERLVCDMKNALKKIFLPSQQSMNDLHLTLDGLNDKAPMNYLSATNDFIADVKNSINTNQPLDFKILNKTGSVNFAFWDNKATIAGVQQSFSEIIRTFATFLLVVVFALWAVSYGRRIFK